MRAMFLLLGVLGTGQVRDVAFISDLSSPQQTTPSVVQTSRSIAQSSASPTPERYTLTPEKRAKAIAYSRARYALHFAGVGLSLAICSLLWLGKMTGVFRELGR